MRRRRQKACDASLVTCSAETRSRLEAGARLFNTGRFFEAHEVWEEAWLGEVVPTRRLLQGLIQVAAGFHKASLGEPKGCAALLEAGLAKLDDSSDEFSGFRLARFREEVAGRLEAARRWKPTEGEFVPRAPRLESVGPG
jgi:uncharacterized protein